MAASCRCLVYNVQSFKTIVNCNNLNKRPRTAAAGAAEAPAAAAAERPTPGATAAATAAAGTASASPPAAATLPAAGYLSGRRPVPAAAALLGHERAEMQPGGVCPDRPVHAAAAQEELERGGT